MRVHSRKGFTLIELLIVVVIIGILATVAIPKFRNTTGKAFTSSIKSDLRNLATAQESYFYDHAVYATTLGQLAYSLSNNVTMSIVEATPGGWSATATHPQAYPITCSLFVGNAAALPPAVDEGVINCQ